MFADITIENLVIQRFSHREFSMGLGPRNGFAIGEALFLFFTSLPNLKVIFFIALLLL